MASRSRENSHGLGSLSIDLGIARTVFDLLESSGLDCELTPRAKFTTTSGAEHTVMDAPNATSHTLDGVAMLPNHCDTMLLARAVAVEDALGQVFSDAAHATSHARLPRLVRNAATAVEQQNMLASIEEAASIGKINGLMGKKEIVRSIRTLQAAAERPNTGLERSDQVPAALKNMLSESFRELVPFTSGDKSRKLDWARALSRWKQQVQHMTFRSTRQPLVPAVT